MSKHVFLSDTLAMLHSLYEFKATYDRTLSFRKHEFFILHQANTKHKNWWEVINEEGDLGYIPSNYVESVTVKPSFYLQFIDNCLESIQKRPFNDNAIERKEVFSRLAEIRNRLELFPEVSGLSNELSYENSGDQSEYASSQSSVISELKNYEEEEEQPIEPMPPIQRPSRDRVQKTIEENYLEKEPIPKSRDNVWNSFEENYLEVEAIQKTSSDKIEESAEDIHEEAYSEVNTDGNKSDCSPTVTNQSIYELLENVRINTQLSHEKCRVAVITVVQGLHELLPASVFPYLSTIVTQAQTATVDESQIEQTHDASRLKIIFTELTSCKEDSEQRSWMLHEDEDIIKEYLSELISILTNADRMISKYVISSGQYHFILTLIQFYQMETRWSIRHLLLQTFGVLCGLDKTAISIMLNSILPGEIARDMMANARNIPKLNYSSILLTMIFSIGEPMPITHHDLLDCTFLLFVLNNIEYPPDTDINEQIPDMFINFIIAFNLQFEDCDENPLLNALEELDVAKNLTEKLLLLLNRELDPVKIFDHKPTPSNSVLKIFLDILSRKTTAKLFYTNDVNVLIDIIVRNILDLSPGDERRPIYLELCGRIMRNTNYEEHRYKIDDILRGFTRILFEENESSSYDQKLIREISNEFPHLLK